MHYWQYKDVCSEEKVLRNPFLSFIRMTHCMNITCGYDYVCMYTLRIYTHVRRIHIHVRRIYMHVRLGEKSEQREKKLLESFFHYAALPACSSPASFHAPLSVMYTVLGHTFLKGNNMYIQTYMMQMYTHTT